jgi:hypothetical protein
MTPVLQSFFQHSEVAVNIWLFGLHGSVGYVDIIEVGMFKLLGIIIRFHVNKL